MWAGTGDTVVAGSGNLYTNINHALFPGAVLVGDDGVAGNDTVTGFSQSAGDLIGFANQTPATVANVVATAQSSNGNTLITFPDGGTMTLVGISKIDAPSSAERKRRPGPGVTGLTPQGQLHRLRAGRRPPGSTSS